MSKRATHWAEIGESTFVAGILLLFWIHRVLGRWPFRVCLWPVVGLHWITRPELRAASLDYLGRLESATGALGHPPGVADGLRHVMRFADTMLDKLLAVSGRYRAEHLRVEGAASLHERSGHQGGGVIITAHMGCLELCRALAPSQGPIRLNVLVHTAHAQEFNRLLERLNPTTDFRLIEVSEMGPATAQMLAERVAKGEFVVIAGDRVPLASERTVMADFLGTPAPFPVGPYVLAALFKCPLWLMTCVHEGHGYAARFELIAEQVDLPRKRRAEALTALAQRYADGLTRVLAASPLDWFNFFRFWDQTHVQYRPKNRARAL